MKFCQQSYIYKISQCSTNWQATRVTILLGNIKLLGLEDDLKRSSLSENPEPENHKTLTPPPIAI